MGSLNPVLSRSNGKIKEKPIALNLVELKENGFTFELKPVQSRSN